MPDQRRVPAELDAGAAAFASVERLRDHHPEKIPLLVEGKVTEILVV
jgi:hypothetical protein